MRIVLLLFMVIFFLGGCGSKIETEADAFKYEKEEYTEPHMEETQNFIGVKVFYEDVLPAECQDCFDDGRVVLYKDNVILTIEIGEKDGQIGYSDSMEGGGEGPGAFTITDDGSVYIVDTVNKRVNIYQNGKFERSFQAPYVCDVTSVAVAGDRIYLMALDSGKIYVCNLLGERILDIVIPEDIPSYYMRKLYVDAWENVWLYYINKDNPMGSLCSCLVEDLSEKKIVGFEGFSKDNVSKYIIFKKEKNSAVIQQWRNSGDYKNGAENWAIVNEYDISVRELLGEISLLDVDKEGALYVSCFEMLDTSVVSGEYTVRKYQNNQCRGICKIDIEDYYYQPKNILTVTNIGELYQLKCFPDSIQVVKKNFVEDDTFESKMDEIKEEVLERESQRREAEQKF